MTKSVREGLSRIRSDNFDTTKLVQLKIESNSWRTELDKLRLKAGITAKDISQYCKLQKGDAVLLTIGNQMDAVSIKSEFSFSPLMIMNFFLYYITIILCNYYIF